MIDKVNRVFAALVKPHWGWYVVLWFFLGVLLFSLIGFPAHLDDKLYTSKYMFFGVLLLQQLCFFSHKFFYTKEDKAYLDSRVNGGIPATDVYFLIKMSSDIGLVKKLLGCLYVLLKVFGYGGIGYIMAVGLFEIMKG